MTQLRQFEFGTHLKLDPLNKLLNFFLDSMKAIYNSYCQFRVEPDEVKVTYTRDKLDVFVKPHHNYLSLATVKN